MKILILHTENDSQTSSIVKLATSLKIKVEVMGEHDAERQILLRLAETSFTKEWDSQEDNHWNEFLKTSADVSKR